MTLEELLNKLIEKGWKPRGCKAVSFYIKDKIIFWLGNWQTNLRELVSKESWLWQYVCENGMVNGEDRWTLNARQKSIYDKFITSEKEYTPKKNYEYRLIESVLCDEDKLEQFLLDNIKTDE